MQLQISTLKKISNNYSHFILDVWGVVHDGSAAYPGAIEAISFLRKEGKKICFLSNAPRRASKVAKMLEKFGVTPDLYDFVLSSGEATFLDLERNQKNGFQNFGKNYFYIGPQKDIDLLDELNYVRVDEAAQAQFAISTGFDNDSSTLAEKLPQAIEAKKNNLPMICVNPDMIVVRQSGQKMICAGTLAREYEKIGGEVFYYGKPFSAVYEMVCEIFGNPEKTKILAVGDGLETDIKGANDFGIDSLLVTGGILASHFDTKLGQAENTLRLEKICAAHGTFPQFAIPFFAA